MIRKKKNYSRPKKAYETSRIQQENQLLKKYGLKNKREVWKTQAIVDYYRGRAMELAKSPMEEQKVLFDKLKEIGLKIDSIADVLALNIEDILQRTLTSVVLKKGLAQTPKHARQLITHKKILIKNKVNSSPRYVVFVSDEDSIKIKQSKPKAKKESKSEELKEEIKEEVKEDK